MKNKSFSMKRLLCLCFICISLLCSIQASAFSQTDAYDGAFPSKQQTNAPSDLIKIERHYRFIPMLEYFNLKFLQNGLSTQASNAIKPFEFHFVFHNAFAVTDGKKDNQAEPSHVHPEGLESPTKPVQEQAPKQTALTPLPTQTPNKAVFLSFTATMPTALLAAITAISLLAGTALLFFALKPFSSKPKKAQPNSTENALHSSGKPEGEVRHE